MSIDSASDGAPERTVTVVDKDFEARATVRFVFGEPSDAITRITGPAGDEWRAQMYALRTEADVYQHWAYNALSNGVTRVNSLDGWADLPDDAVRFAVTNLEVEV